MFYIDVGTLNADVLYCRRIVEGKREDLIINDFQPTLYTRTNKKTEYTDMFGNYMQPRHFETATKMRDFVKMASNSNMELYGMQNIVSQYITNTFPENIKYVPSQVKILYFDIETSLISESTHKKEFPNPSIADHEITAMTFFTREEGYTSFTTLDIDKDYIVKAAHEQHGISDSIKINIVKCSDERDMLFKFLDFWEETDADIFTAWNSTEFDLPFIYNRICRILSQKTAARLSQFNRCRSQTRENKFKKQYDLVEVYGRAHVDLLVVYQKFIRVSHPNYKLDTIAEYEIGAKKLDYSKYSDLEEFMIADPSEYLLYNIIDVLLLYGVAEKTKLVDVVMGMSLIAHSTPSDVIYATSQWDNLIYNNFHHSGKVIPAKVRNESGESIKGGFVKFPKMGKLGWGGSLDAKSMYPSAIVTNNISPDTFIEYDDLPDELKQYYGINRVIDFFAEPEFMKTLTPLLVKYNVTYTPNGAFYKKDFKGFYPVIMEGLLTGRDIVKTEKKQWEQLSENVKVEMKKRGIKK